MTDSGSDGEGDRFGAGVFGTCGAEGLLNIFDVVSKRYVVFSRIHGVLMHDCLAASARAGTCSSFGCSPT